MVGRLSNFASFIIATVDVWEGASPVPASLALFKQGQEQKY